MKYTWHDMRINVLLRWPWQTLTMLLLMLTLMACGESQMPSATAAETSPKVESSPHTSRNPDMVRVRVITPEGKLSDPVEQPKLELSVEQWKQRLTSEQFMILRSKGTERPFCGGLLKNKEAGIYVCAGCHLPLFASGAKFESGTGWPSFFQPVAKENILEEADYSHGMTRIEIMCKRCEGHLGHVFEDGPRPTGLRYCLNSESLTFISEADLPKHGEKITATPAHAASPASTQPHSANPSITAQVVLAGGCFWCVEAVFEQLDGVQEVVSGYAGGSAEDANYKAVCTGETGHAEVVKITYDPAKVTLEQLLKIHFATHDPTTLNRQGNDVGPQYRSAIFYASDEQKQLAQAFMADLNDAKVFKKPIVTTLEPLTKFYPAEAYHQDYAACNVMNPYIRGIALPKVEKVREKFPDMIKPQTTP